MRPDVQLALTLHADYEYLERVRDLIEEDVQRFEISPETLWRTDSQELVPNEFYGVLHDLKVRSGRPLVGHGLSFSVGSARGSVVDERRRSLWLRTLERTQRDFGFEWYSEHLGFTALEGTHAQLPLPLPFTEEAVDAVVASMRDLSSVFPKVLIETSANLFSMGSFEEGAAFLMRILEESQASLLLDLHNVWTEACNLGHDARAFLERLDLDRVLEIHVSGGSHSEPSWLESQRIFRLDSHDDAVPEEVWALFEAVAPDCPNLKAVVLERLNGTFGAAEVQDLRGELARARRLLDAAGPRNPPRRSVHGRLPRGSGLEPFERLLIAALNSESPVEAYRSDGLGIEIDEDALTLTGLIVRKLRFERICRGDREASEWFESDPNGFVAVFRIYGSEVRPTEFFPEGEAQAFRAFCKSRGIANPYSAFEDAG